MRSGPTRRNRDAIVAAFITGAATIVAALIGVVIVIFPRDASPAPSPSLSITTSSLAPTATSPVSTPTPSVGSSAAGRIASPANNASVPIGVTVLGTAAPVASDHELRLFVEFIQDKRSFPGEGPIQLRPDGQWSGQIDVGGPGQAGQQMNLHLADLGPAAIQKLRDYFAAERATGNVLGLSRNELDALGVTILDTVTVNRV